MSFQRASGESEAIRRIHEAENRTLAPYAMRSADTRGRRHVEAPHPYRSAYLRDRDRIIHSACFRRLMYKTQVFVGQPNDHQRTRLTHTLEVAQIARTVARNLRLNEDLTETIALAHDLGHPPFGHAGERALSAAMAPHGGFEHNRQGLRLVERLEHRYPSFIGLNLSYEVLESIALHSSLRQHPDLAEFGPEQRMLAESQVVDLSDSVAYDTHDIDDALRAGLVTFEDLRETEMWRRAEERARATYGSDLAGKQLARAVIRSMIDWQVSSLLKESERRLADVSSVDDVKRAAINVISLEPDVSRQKSELEQFLFAKVYRHEQVVRTTRVAERMVRGLFDELTREPMLLSEKYRLRMKDEPIARVVCDYVAGMTDRYAQHLYRSLFEP
ncbi:MAG: deoxyguanosinetriphosphate triphosphohydrolase [Planctomycetota bacterium]